MTFPNKAAAIAYAEVHLEIHYATRNRKGNVWTRTTPALRHVGIMRRQSKERIGWQSKTHLPGNTGLIQLNERFEPPRREKDAPTRRRSIKLTGWQSEESGTRRIEPRKKRQRRPRKPMIWDIYRLRVGPKTPETRNIASGVKYPNDNGKWVTLTYER